MSILNIPDRVAHEWMYQEIKQRTRDLAGPPPQAAHRGHHLVNIRLSYGEFAITDIGRYSAKCIHPEHHDSERYPNCHRVRMITPPLQDIEFEHLRRKIEFYTRVTKRPWLLGQQARGAQPAPVIDVDAQ